MRIDPHPPERVGRSQLAELLYLLVSLHRADIRVRPVFPLLETDFLMAPRVRQNGIPWEVVVGDEIPHFPRLVVEESHAGQKIETLVVRR